MANNTLVEIRLSAMSGLLKKNEPPNLTVPPTYKAGIQEGEEIKSFARANAEDRLPKEAVLFIIPKGDVALIERVAGIISKASSPDDKIWDPFLTYVEANPNTVKPLVMSREQVVEEVLRRSESRGRAILDETGSKIKGMYGFQGGYVFAHRPDSKRDEAELPILGEIIEENKPQLLDTQAASGLENTAVILAADENNMALPPTQTLEKKVQEVFNIAGVLEGASKVIAFIVEEDISDKKVEAAKEELKQMTTTITSQEAGIKTQANLSNNPFLGGIARPEDIQN